ncbi:arylsulfatase B-like [Pomacea canaliculata]|uniref:arylsulfatase B-like n=1 Tax=Pomacea canaliculata TaxID=400727 RepID=UPI000D737CB1|nr:arylsulfatase B-like [Pomacea canaliculata]
MAARSLLVLLACVMAREAMCQQPNIIIFLADDVGWADLQRHDQQMRTPNIERLARDGMFLNQSYVLPTCAPTRSALLTSRWPYTIGMQVNQIKGTNLAWLDENLTLLPQTMKQLNYSTHMIGKWHLGHCNWALTPTRRGFDTFYGFYTNSMGYFNHSGESEDRYDFRDNDEVVWSARGQYAPELHTARAQRIIREQRRSRTPFFLYYAMQTAHAPYEAKQKYIDMCSHVTNRKRRIHCGMVAAMDESIGNITDTLEAEGCLDDTIILFASDNGGPLEGGSSNWPLRGQKSTLWEGGTRSFTVLRSPMLRRRGVTYPGSSTPWTGTPPSSRLPVAHLQQVWMVSRCGTPCGPHHRVRELRWCTTLTTRVTDMPIREGDWKLCKGRPGRKYLGWYPPASMPGLAWEEVKRQDVPEWQLFNIAVDPEERHNVYNAPENQAIVSRMKQLMENYKRRLRPFRRARKEPRGKAKNFGGVETPGWCQLGTARPTSTTTRS